jgi:hypothetical protein
MLAPTFTCTAPDACVEDACSEDELALQDVLAALATRSGCETAGGVYTEESQTEPDMERPTARGSLAGGTQLSFTGGGFSDAKYLNGEYATYTYLCSDESPCNLIDPEFGVDGEFEGGIECDIDSVDTSGIACTTRPQEAWTIDDGSYTDVSPCKTHDNNPVLAFDEESCELTGNTWSEPCVASICSGNDDGTTLPGVCVAPDCMIPYDCNATETANIASVAALGVPARCTAPGCADPEACTEGEAAVVAVVATLGIHPLEIKCTEAGGEWERLRHSRSYASLCSAANGTYLFQSTPCGLNADASACSVKGGDCTFRTNPIDAPDITSCRAQIPELNSTAGQVLGYAQEKGTYRMLYTISKTFCDAPAGDPSNPELTTEIQQRVAAAIEGVDNPPEASCIENGGEWRGDATTKLLVSCEPCRNMFVYKVGNLYTVSDEVQGDEEAVAVTGILYRHIPLSSQLIFCPSCGRLEMALCSNIVEDDRVDLSSVQPDGDVSESMWSVPIACNMPPTLAEVKTIWSSPCSAPDGTAVLNASSVEYFECQQPDFMKSVPEEYKIAEVLVEHADLVNSSAMAVNMNGSACRAPACADPMFCTAEERDVVENISEFASSFPVNTGVTIFGDYATTSTVANTNTATGDADPGVFYPNGVEKLDNPLFDDAECVDCDTPLSNCDHRCFWQFFSLRNFTEAQCLASGGLFEADFSFSMGQNVTTFFNETACSLSTTTILQPRELCMTIPCELSQNCTNARRTRLPGDESCPIWDEGENMWHCTADECLCEQVAEQVAAVQVAMPDNLTNFNCTGAGGIFNRTCVASVCAELRCGLNDIDCIREDCTGTFYKVVDAELVHLTELEVAIAVAALEHTANETECVAAHGTYYPTLKKLTYNHTWQKVTEIDPTSCESTNNTWTGHNIRSTSEFLAYQKSSANKVLYPADCRVSPQHNQLDSQITLLNALDDSNRLIPGRSLAPNAVWNAVSSHPEEVSGCSFTHDVERTPRITVHPPPGYIGVGSLIEFVLEDYPVDIYEDSQVDDFVIAVPAEIGIHGSFGERLCTGSMNINAAKAKCHGGAQFWGDPRTLQGLHGWETGCTDTNFTAADAGPQHHCGPYTLGGHTPWGHTPCRAPRYANITRRSVFCEVAPMAAAEFRPSISVAPYGIALVNGVLDIRPVVELIDDGADSPRTGSKAGGAELVIQGRGLIDWETQLQIDIAGVPCEVTSIFPDP